MSEPRGLNNKIRKIALIYLTQASGEYYITDSPDYNIQRRPQLGLQYLSAILEKRGVKTDIFDQTVTLFNSNWLVEKLRRYDLAGFYSSDSHEDKIKAYCKRIKEELNIPILVGGPGTLANSTFLDYGCDMVVHGEGEITIQQIIEYYNGERELWAVRGVSYKNGGKVIKASAQELINNLDELPFPDRSKVDINSYYDYFLFGMKKPYATIIASRGCIHRCTFCNTSNIWGYKYRRRTVNNVLSEIDEIVKRYRIKFISFQDEIFGIDNEWIKEFCKRLTARPYKISWMAIFHPFTLSNDTEAVLKLMQKAGCNTLSFGLQSAHPEILKNINRNPSEPQKLKKVIKIANKLGLVTVVGYIFALPGDTRQTIQATIDYSLSCGSTLAEYYRLSIFKGSQIERAFQDKKTCGLSEEEIKRLTVYASRKFYTKPTTALRIVYNIVKNPGWLIKVRSSIPSILARVGIIKSAKND